MGIYKKGNTYWMIKQHDGKRIERSLDTKVKRVAEERYAKIVAEIIDGDYFRKEILKKLLKDMIVRYESEYTSRKDYYQKARDKTIFGHLYEYFGENATLKHVGDNVGGYEQHRQTAGASPATIVKELGLLRRMFNVARKQWKWKLENPVSDIELPKVRNERVRYLSEDEHGRLFKALDEAKDKWLRGLVITALGTGLRLSNLCSLQWREIDLMNKMIIIEAEKMKNDEYLGIPFPENVHRELCALQRVKSLGGYVFHDKGEPLYPVKVQRAFRQALKAARVANFRFHDLRHCYCSALRQRNVDLHTIAKLAGHRDLRMTKRYAHLNVENLREAVSRLESTTILRQQDKALGAHVS